MKKAVKKAEMKTLTTKEQAEFDRLHLIVSKWIDGWEAVAKALKEIKERQLYRMKYPNFDDYCKSEFGFGKRRSYQLTQALEVKQLIEFHDSEAAKELDRPGKVAAITNQPVATAIKTIKAAQKTGKKVTAKTLKIASSPTGKESAKDILMKIVARLEALRTEKVTWGGHIEYLNKITEIATELKK